MDQSTVTQIDQNRNPKPNNQQQLDPTATYAPHYTYAPPNAAPIDPNQNPNPSNLDPYYAYYAQFYSDPSHQIRLPGVVESQLASASSYPHGHTVSYEHYDPATGYYYDTDARNWAAKEAVRAYGTDPNAAYVNIALPPNGTQQLAIKRPTSTIRRSNPSLPRNGTRNKHPNKAKKPQVAKVVQAAFCEVCKVECNTNDILEQHKAGKKHKKNVEKLQKAAATSVPNPLAETSNLVIGLQENPNSEQNKKRSAESVNDLETKRQKLLQGGAAEKAVRTCTLCNVVCNSETVYGYHLAGHKHNAMLKKHAGKVAVPSTT